MFDVSLRIADAATIIDITFGVLAHACTPLELRVHVHVRADTRVDLRLVHPHVTSSMHCGSETGRLLVCLPVRTSRALMVLGTWYGV